MEEKVILVNKQDEEIGLEEKLQAHRQGLLHRAFSIFIFNKEGQMLLQRRAKCKYHSPYLWTNACCSHPRKFETIEAAAHRRLQEEFGFDCPLKEMFSFYYFAKLDEEMHEHEYDHVLFGRMEQGNFPFNPEEIAEYKWIDIPQLEASVEKEASSYTVWFKIALEQVLKRYYSVKISKIQ
jgi:isopentenyl-diphosphate Delta-isomerase